MNNEIFVSDVLMFLKLEFNLTNDLLYDENIDIQSLNLKIHNGERPTQQEFIEAAKDFTFNKFIKNYTILLENHLDKVARDKGYDNALSCISYVNSTVPEWKNESVKFNSWRDQCFEYAFNHFNNWETEKLVLLSAEDFISNLPPFSWDE